MAIALSFCFMLVEIAGGIYANSLSILADAAHLFTDVTGFVIALIAVILATHPPTSSFTYGLARAEVMGAFCSVLTLWLVTIYLVYTAYIRILMWIEGKAEPVDGKLMFIIAAFGICVNVCLGLVFHDDASSLSAHAHDHSHEHGHGHEHDHGHDHGHRFDHNVAELDHDRKHGHKHDHKHGHDRGHDHGHESHDHGHGHGHSHDHAHADEKTSLIATSHNNAHTYGGAELDSACIESDHQHDHAHGEHHQESCSSGDHAPVLVYAAPHSGGGDLNLQAAYMHVIADLIQSAGVALAGALIWYNPEWQIIDPICTFLFSILVVWATFALMYRIVSIFMEGTPAHVSAHNAYHTFSSCFCSA